MYAVKYRLSYDKIHVCSNKLIKHKVICTYRSNNKLGWTLSPLRQQGRWEQEEEEVWQGITQQKYPLKDKNIFPLACSSRQYTETNFSASAACLGNRIRAVVPQVTRKSLVFAQTLNDCAGHWAWIWAKHKIFLEHSIGYYGKLFLVLTEFALWLGKYMYAS